MNIKIKLAISKCVWNKRHLSAGLIQKGKTLEPYVKKFYLLFEQTKRHIIVEKSKLNEQTIFQRESAKLLSYIAFSN
jgi:hypothetical protein